MGAQQSSTKGSSGPSNGTAAGPPKTCYYELLGVERQASEDA
jgi:hypothetical protein